MFCFAEAYSRMLALLNKDYIHRPKKTLFSVFLFGREEHITQRLHGPPLNTHFGLILQQRAPLRCPNFCYAQDHTKTNVRTTPGEHQIRFSPFKEFDESWGKRIKPEYITKHSFTSQVLNTPATQQWASFIDARLRNSLDRQMSTTRQNLSLCAVAETECLQTATIICQELR